MFPFLSVLPYSIQYGIPVAGICSECPPMAVGVDCSICYEMEGSLPHLLLLLLSSVSACWIRGTVNVPLGAALCAACNPRRASAEPVHMLEGCDVCDCSGWEQASPRLLPAQLWWFEMGESSLKRL